MAGPPAVVNISSSPSSTQTRLPHSSHRLPTVSASEALQELQSHGTDSESTGLKALDALLHNGAGFINGGFERGKVTEIWGPIGAGKTAIMLQAASQALSRGHGVVWVDSETPLSGSRVRSVTEQLLSSPARASSAFASVQDCLRRFSHVQASTLSHLLALTLHPRPGFPAEGTSLLIIDGVNTLIDLDYPRFPFAGLAKTEQQKWQTGRRYAVLGSLVSALNKLAVLNNLAVVVTTGCASRMRSDSGLGSALVPGVGGGEWDSGVWTRLTVFRDLGGRRVGLQKSQGRSLISREEIGEVGKVIAFEVAREDGVRDVLTAGDVERVIPKAVLSPVKPRKRTYDEVADSDGEDVDEYGWAEKDEDALAVGGLEELGDTADTAAVAS